METGKEYARQFGERTTVFLDVESPNVGAIQSYLSIGFEFDPIK
jgi:ribosomal protein S18 acetylase RimI-like enzyme